MGLSSNTLWHQTKKDGLKGIIKDKCLYLSYSLEDMTSLGYTAKFAYPMVSVCDLPLSETGNYLKKYGDYMIGLAHMGSDPLCDKGNKKSFMNTWRNIPGKSEIHPWKV